MIKNLIAVLLFSLSFVVQAQKTIGKEFKKYRVEEVDFSKLYDKSSGKKIKKKEAIRLFEKNPNLIMEPVIGNDGSIEKYLIDPSSEKLNRKPAIKKQIKAGNVFPNLKFKSIEGEKIVLDNLKGKLIILRFEMDVAGFRLKSNEILSINDKINALENKNDVQALIIFDASKDEIEKFFPLDINNFSLIPNGFNIQRKLELTRFPTTLIIDRERHLIDYFNQVDEIDLELLLSK